MPFVKEVVEPVQMAKAGLGDDDKPMASLLFVGPTGVGKTEVAVGDGDNDADMARLAHIGIGFGGVREIAPALLQTIDYAFLDDRLCADFLRKLL